MSDTRFARAREVFLAACELTGEEQGAYVARACGGDADLAAVVAQLLEGHRRPLSALESPALALVPSIETEETLPEHVGSYRILDLLGAGGMGVVYRARQEHPDRTVALKVIRSRFVTEELLRRFEYEAQALGSLNHPGIAQVYEAGTADSGAGPQPFIAMEYVAGLPLHEHCDEHAPDARERVRLLARICDAVHHAHQKGVLHRDLKPANVLVTAAGAPKVLDFGIARAVDASEPETPRGTPSYMSPEQRDPDAVPPDTRADVYALGVIGRELLGDGLASARARPLDAILRRAVATRREDRYDSASALAADLARFLAFRPVEARPARGLEHLALFARRNRALSFSLAGIALFALLALWQGQRAVRAAERARLEAQRKETANEFLREMLQYAQPAGARGREVTVREILDGASERVETSFTGQPELEAFMRTILADSYVGLGLYGEAELHLGRARELLDGALGPDHPDALEADAGYGALLLLRGDLEGSARMQSAAYEALRPLLGEDDPRVLQIAHNLGQTFHSQGAWEQAEELLQRAWDGRARTLGPEHRDTLVSMGALGTLLCDRARLDEAELLLRRALEGLSAELGDDHPYALTTLGNLIGLLRDRGETAEALELSRRELGISVRVLGEEHLDTLVSKNNLAMLLADGGERAGAALLLREVTDTYRRTAQESHPEYLKARHNLADVLEREGELEEAALISRAVLEERRRILGGDHPSTLLTVSQLALVLRDQGRLEEAVREYRAALAGLGPPDASDAPYRGVLERDLGRTLAELGQVEEGEATLRAGVDRLAESVGEADPRTRRALEDLAALYAAQGREEAAARCRDRLLATNRKADGASD